MSSAPVRCQWQSDTMTTLDDVIKWKHFPCYWTFVRVNSPHKGQWCGALMFSLISVWINGWKKQSWGWWFETLSCPLWRHCNDHNNPRSQINNSLNHGTLHEIHGPMRNGMNFTCNWFPFDVCILSRLNWLIFFQSDYDSYFKCSSQMSKKIIYNLLIFMFFETLTPSE